MILVEKHAYLVAIYHDHGFEPLSGAWPELRVHCAEAAGAG
jgi:hypothetical protein